MGAAYANNQIVNPVSDPQVERTRRSNTNCRIVTALFTNEILPGFSKINDRKDRKDYEQGNGPKNERLFQQISEMVNDTDSTDLDELILPDNPGDEHITAAVDDDGINPKDFNQQSWQSVAKTIHKFTKARKAVAANMTLSGTHGSDTWDFVEAALKKAKVTNFGQLEVYYFVMHCKAHPEVDAIFNVFLEEGIKFESTDSPGEDGGGADSSTTKSQAKVQNEMLKQLKETTKIAAAMLGNSDDAVKHRAKSNRRDEARNSRDDESNRRSNFNFYMQLSEKKEDLLSVTGKANNRILSSINKELAKLKKNLGLEEDDSSSDGESLSSA